ncbi:MAG TPA: lipoprotein-releasing ABC transporter permease subunit [Cellvibrionales bacterium]|nr:lipoprotein-releasing ABC transporter permease subunit [Cellvibrionales bacterium]
MKDKAVANSSTPQTISVSERFGSTSVFLGWRFFAGRERNALVSFISAVSIAGLSLAIALLIVVLSVMNGFEKEFRERILGLAPHATLWFAAPVDDWQGIVSSLESEADVIRAQPIIEFKAMAVAANRVQPVLVQGVDYSKVSTLMKAYLGSSQQEGTAKHQATVLAEKNLVIGAGLAKQLALSAGDKLRLMVPDSSAINSSGFDAASRAVSHSFILSDTLQTGTEIDNGIALINLSDAARISQLGSQVQGIQLQVVDIFQARHIATHLAINHQLPVRISDWTQSFGNLYTAIQLSRQMVVLLLTSIIAVAVFNVFVTLGMVVKHKRADIAILRTLGFTRRGVLLSFVIQGMLISIVGCIVGAVAGCLLALAAPSFVGGIEILLGVELLRTDIYPINYLPSQIKAADIALVCLVALTMSLLATLYPAWRAASILPAKALRHL